MSQPFDRMAICPAPVKPDERLKDWWVDNPWKIAAAGKSLSGYERNRIFLNGGTGTQTVAEGAAVIVRMAQIGSGGPTGSFLTALGAARW